jgi:hypothetical protein
LVIFVILPQVDAIGIFLEIELSKRRVKGQRNETSSLQIKRGRRKEG